MEKIIRGLSNVLFDESSDNKLDSLNETIFIKNVLLSLSKIMKEEFDEYVFFILSSHDANVIPSSVNYESTKKKVLIFMSDESGTLPDYLSPNYHAIFKAYMHGDPISSNNIFNFSLGCVREVPEFPNIPMKSRKHSVFFSGNLNNHRVKLYSSLFSMFLPIRIPTLNRLSVIKKVLLNLKSNFDDRFPNSHIRFTNGFRQGVNPVEYGKMIANSKIVLCPKGFYSAECFRHYEAMRAGCVIVSEKLPDTYFYKDSPIIQIDSWEEGLRKVSQLIDNPVELDKLSRATRIWWDKKCSEYATAKFINSSINKLKSQSLINHLSSQNTCYTV